MHKKLRPKILVITPVRHIRGVPDILQSIGEVDYFDDPSAREVLEVIAEYDAIYTNPNKSKVFIGADILQAGRNLKVICTASTGTNHIDKAFAEKLGIPILALTEEREVINRISSTAELAFALTLASLRHVVKASNSVLDGEWDYEKYIGRQMDFLTVGSIGYGRLGEMYCGYCKAMGSKIIVYDPYKKIHDKEIQQVEKIEDLLRESDVIAIHVHVSDETTGMINMSNLSYLKKDVILVNTSRGDIVNEHDLVAFLKSNPEARIATDVLADEIKNRSQSSLLDYAYASDQVVITPHIGGMCREAQEIAYGHAANRLQIFFATGSKA